MRQTLVAIMSQSTLEHDRCTLCRSEKNGTRYVEKIVIRDRCWIDAVEFENRSRSHKKKFEIFFALSPISRSVTALKGLNVVHHHRRDEQSVE